MPSATPAPGPKLMSLGKRPSTDWLLEHGYASEMVDWRGDKIPGLGVSRMPCVQEVAYVENVGHQPPVSDSPQWAWKKKKDGPSAVSMTTAGDWPLTGPATHVMVAA